MSSVNSLTQSLAALLKQGVATTVDAGGGDGSGGCGDAGIGGYVQALSDTTYKGFSSLGLCFAQWQYLNELHNKGPSCKA